MVNLTVQVSWPSTDTGSWSGFCWDPLLWLLGFACLFSLGGRGLSCVLLSPVDPRRVVDFSVRSFPSVYENVICSGLLNLPLNPHLQSQVCPIFVLLFTKHNKTKQTNQAAKYMSIFAVFIFSPQFIQLILIRLSAPQLYLNCHCHGINVHLAMSKGHFSVLSSY